MKNKSYLTAIKRKELPAPTQWLLKVDAIAGPALDYGCGTCHKINNQYFHADGYDPYYHPNGLIEGRKYATIICNYVLCVLMPRERAQVLKHIKSLLVSGGAAYIAVRNDRPRNGWGRTKKNTYQAKVRLNLPCLHKEYGFRTYLLTN
jgi:SAM-dependent methyltransferase